MILITGNRGYIGSVMTQVLQEQSRKVLGFDCNFFKGCELFDLQTEPDKQIICDIRDIKSSHLKGVTSIIHLAGLSNDPLGELIPQITPAINTKASIRLAKLAKQAKVEKFIFASSCSLYGISEGDTPITEEGILNPITEYAKSKAEVEAEVSKLADKNFHPVFMRNATVFGLSPVMRLDLVVNNLVAYAYITGKISVMSDGTPWRPLIHIRDLSHAVLKVLDAPHNKIHNEVFNVGFNEGNYQIKEIAHMIEERVPNCQVEILNKTGLDERTYRVDFSKIQNFFPDFKRNYDLQSGINELYEGYQNHHFRREDFTSPKYFRLRWIEQLMQSQKLDAKMQWLVPTS